MESLSVSRLVHGYLSQSECRLVSWQGGLTMYQRVGWSVIRQQVGQLVCGSVGEPAVASWGLLAGLLLDDWLGTEHFVSISVIYVTQLQENNFCENYVNHFQVLRAAWHWGRDSSIVNDPLGEPGCTPLYVGLHLCAALLTVTLCFPPYAGGLLYGDSGRHR